MLITDLCNKEYCQFCNIKLKPNHSFKKVIYECSNCQFNIISEYIDESDYHINYHCAYEQYTITWTHDIFTFNIVRSQYSNKCEICYKTSENKFKQLYFGFIDFIKTKEELYKFINKLIKQEIFK